MKINKLTASFGKLENETLKLHGGLNVIYAPNESGKSTWCAFIRAMLYGVDSAERAKAGYLPDKQRYAPWSGAPMEGSMELTADGCDITITRRTRQKNAPMKDFTATYTGSNVPVEGLNSSNAGEMLTGVSRDVFRRSAFIAQGTVAVTGSPELEKRISAIVSTGEEHSSYSEADERLRQWQRKRRYNRRGLLPELEARIDDTQRALDSMDGSMNDMDQLERRLAEAQEDCRRLEAQVTDSRRRQRREALDRLSKGRAETERCSKEHDEAMERLAQSRQELSQSPFGMAEPQLLKEEIDRDLEKLRELKTVKMKKGALLPALLLFVLAAAAAALYVRYDHYAYIIPAAICCIGAIALFFRHSRAKHSVAKAQEERWLLLKKYRASCSGDISAAYEEHCAAYEKMLLADKAEKSSRLAFENARNMQQSLEDAALSELDFAAGNSEAARLGRELSAARNNAQRLSQQIAELGGRLTAMGDPLVLTSALSSMQDEYELLCGEYEAISLAVEVLKEADSEIQSRFSPELGRVAAGYMSAVTGGRYSDVLINRDFTARTRTADDAVAREAEYLSAGTLDLMYLAVRLAVCELALPEGESCPLIIDDALVNLDETRQQQAMELLKQIARKRQVILFSCRELDREEKA